MREGKRGARADAERRLGDVGRRLDILAPQVALVEVRERLTDLIDTEITRRWHTPGLR